MAGVKVTNLAKILASTSVRPTVVRVMYSTSSGEFGSGAGKGGGAGGTVREAGGSLGKREAAQEEQYFRKKQAEQLSALHDHLEEEIRQHQQQIKLHEDAIKRHKDKMENLKKAKH